MIHYIQHCSIAKPAAGVAAERKRCADVARKRVIGDSKNQYWAGFDEACKNIAAAIERGDA